MGSGDRIRAAKGWREMDRLKLETLLFFLGLSIFTCFSNDSARSSSSLSSQNGKAEGAFNLMTGSFAFAFSSGLMKGGHHEEDVSSRLTYDKMTQKS